VCQQVGSWLPSRLAWQSPSGPVGQQAAAWWSDYLVRWQSGKSMCGGWRAGGQRPSGPVEPRLGGAAGWQAGGSGVGVVACLFFQCIMMWRSLPWARSSGC
jgi:hypothetical protein